MESSAKLTAAHGRTSHMLCAGQDACPIAICASPLLVIPPGSLPTLFRRAQAGQHRVEGRGVDFSARVALL